MTHSTQRPVHPMKKYALLIVIVIALISFYYSGLNKYLNLTVLQENQEALLAWANKHYLFSITLYIIFFSTMIACTIPCATLLTILGGLLFGYSAILYAGLSVILGGFTLFHAVRTAVGARITRARKGGWMKRLESGFKKNAFHYLLMLRLMPIFPCWVSNIGAGALNVPQQTFLIASSIGILPSTIIYVLVGIGLNDVLTQHQPITLNSVLKPSLMVPLIALAIFSLVPVIYNHVDNFRKTKQKRKVKHLSKKD